MGAHLHRWGPSQGREGEAKVQDGRGSELGRERVERPQGAAGSLVWDIGEVMWDQVKRGSGKLGEAGII